LQVIFHKRATNYRALWQKMTYEDMASYDSTPPCSQISGNSFTQNHAMQTRASERERERERVRETKERERVRETKERERVRETKEREGVREQDKERCT